ncbi:MAG: nuclear transport factor 2 family protein [Gemmataceae bacterium]|nr:nuclear transport factor 2 family protein [Gemmataceae bacterium]
MTNVDRLKAAFAAWHHSRGADHQVWLDLAADGFVLRSVADGRPGMEFSATRTGRGAVLDYFAGLAADWEMLHYSADEFVADGDRVVVIGRCGWRHRRTGKPVESPTVTLWRFRDGRAVEVFEMYDTAKAIAATQPD